MVSDPPPPHAFPGRTSRAMADHAVRPDYRDGVSVDSHRLPYRPHLAGRPDIDDPATVPEGADKVNRSGPQILARVGPSPLLSLRVLSLCGKNVDSSCFEKTLRGIPRLSRTESADLAGTGDALAGSLGPLRCRASLDRVLKSFIVSVYRLNVHVYHGGRLGVSTAGPLCLVSEHHIPPH